MVCGKDRPTTASTLSTTPNDCWIPTYGGTAVQQSVCVLPFSYRGVTYTGCTTVDNSGYPWCYTSVNYENDHIWGNCQGIVRILWAWCHAIDLNYIYYILPSRVAAQSTPYAFWKVFL